LAISVEIRECDAPAAAMVRTALLSGERLGIPVQAEDIETKAQATVEALVSSPTGLKPSELLIFSRVVDAKE